ncbi:type III secretion protein [Pseudomonas sp. Bout1]|uniref:type III secretion protein n=1 Tax=Pseudomonas sp. Bout1 TaxID=3048600 RepID=UPI002AB40E01|nr:type III secretion protein [Pseudomonas sp. Bout1]MDY7530919.1 type III secretion protein [Pseudomonas sp. Bout1]MEB0189006.1 type III secretion protein [Pseudomonas sp. Bout1]
MTRWLSSHKEQLNLFEDDDEIVLRRQAGVMLLSVQLTGHRPDNTRLGNWTRPGRASLSHFKGALAQAPANGALWLLQRVPANHGLEPLLADLESLLNQRDTWRAIVARVTTPIRSPLPTSLRVLPS